MRVRVSLGGQGFPMYQVEGGLRLGTLLGWGSDILSPLACCYPSLPGPLGPPSSQILLLAAEPSEFRPTSDAVQIESALPGDLRKIGGRGTVAVETGSETIPTSMLGLA